MALLITVRSVQKIAARTTCSDHKHISLHTYFAARTLRRIFQVRVMHQKLSSEKMERNRR